MKKIFSMLLVAAGLVLTGQTLTSCSSCSGSKEQEIVDPSTIFTKQDTLQVLDMVDQFSMRLREGDVKGAVEMLRYLKEDRVEELSPLFVQRQANALQHIAGRSHYEIDRIVFRDDFDNEAKLDITLFEKEDENDKRPNKTSFYFRPVRISGNWYLTTKDNITDSRGDLNKGNQEIRNLLPGRNADSTKQEAPKAE